MAITLHLVLVVIALGCFALAAFASTRWPNYNLVAAGLFCWLLAVAFFP